MPRAAAVQVMVDGNDIVVQTLLVDSIGVGQAPHASTPASHPFAVVALGRPEWRDPDHDGGDVHRGAIVRER